MHQQLIAALSKEAALHADTPLASLLRRAAEALRDCSADDSKIPYEDIIASYNKHLATYLPRAGRCPAGRKAVIRARWNEFKDQRSLEWWDSFFAKIAASDFLTGRRAPGKEHSNWRPNFDWFTKAANVTKIIEGSYDNRGPRFDIDAMTRDR